MSFAGIGFVCVFALSVSPAFAQEGTAASSVVALAADQAPQLVPSPVQPPVLQTAKQRRPPVLIPMYVSLAGIQALDVHSTYRALANRNAQEANPVVRGLVGNKAAFACAKLAATASEIVATEKMWRKHRAASIAFVAISNAAMAVIVAHNYRVARQ